MVRISSFSNLLKGLLAVLLTFFGLFGLAKVGVVRMIVPAKYVDLAYNIIDVGFSTLVYLFLIGCAVVGVWMIVSCIRNKGKPKEPTIADLLIELKGLRQDVKDGACKYDKPKSESV